jgi:hypothetical protein
LCVSSVGTPLFLTIIATCLFVAHRRLHCRKTGRAADLSDYKNHTITDNAKGFKMLQKAGWKEGEGLGSEGQGRLLPVNQGATAGDALGQLAPCLAILLRCYQ